MTRQIKVDIVGNSKPFTNALDQAVGKVTGFKGKMEALGGGSLKKGLAIGAGVASFNLLTSAISAGVSQLDEMHNAYLADQESQLRLQNVLKNTEADYNAAAKAAEAFANAQIELGFQDDDVRDSLGKLRGVTKDLAEAQKLVQLAMDISRAKNKSLEESTQAVIQAVNGQSRGMKALGINTQGAANATQLLAAATNNVKGAADAYAKSGPGKLDKANAKLSETFEKLGGAIDKVSQFIIPIMSAGLGAIVDAAGELIAALEPLGTFIGGALTAYFQALNRVLSFTWGLLSGIVGVAANAIGAIQNAIGGGSGSGGPQSTTTGGVTSTTYQGTFLAPTMHSGGVVPGPYGSDQLIMAQAGERVIPTGQSAAQVININIASFIGSDRDIDRFSDRIAFRLRATSLG